jgi:hypothetical protein
MKWARRKQLRDDQSGVDSRLSGIHKALGVSLLALLLLTLCNTAAIVNAISAKQQYPSGPWGLGIVVPENSRFADGSHLSWAEVDNVSLEVTLPNITFSDYPTLAVESLMAADGSVIQIAAGIYPGNSKWLAYGWFIGNVEAYPQSYEWVLNSSGPEMAAGARISLSLSLVQGRWRYRIENLRTHEVAEGEYASTVPPKLRVGDQEVFALESYTTSTFVFAHMGNITLDALEINERNIVTGWYPYGSWDTRHNPLFVVGGLDPPTYISLQETPDGTLRWSYEQWSASKPTTPSNFPTPVITGIAILCGTLIPALFYVMRRRKRR